MEETPFYFLGKLLILIGAFIILVGIILIFAGKIPYLGRLPGDIFIQRKNFTFYFPITTLILLNLILFVIFWLFRKH